MGKKAVVRDDGLMTGHVAQMWSRRGTHQISVHAVLDLEDPADEVVLLTLEISCILGILDGAEDTKHTRSCPAVT